MCEWSRRPSDQSPNRYIDRVSTEDALRMLNAEDRLVAPAVTAVVPDLARLVDEAAIRIRAGGRVHYFGAGTSGRLAVLDAAELLPTFGLGDVVVAHHAGGTAALVEAIEDVEDSEDDGAAAAEAVATGDLVDRPDRLGSDPLRRWGAARRPPRRSIHRADDLQPPARARRRQRPGVGRRHRARRRSPDPPDSRPGPRKS